MFPSTGCYLLGRGRRDRQQNLLLFRDTSASTASGEQLLDNPFCSRLEQGRCEHWCHHTLVSFEPRTTGQRDGKRISDPGPKHVEDKRATEGQLLPPLTLRQKRDLRKLRKSFSCKLRQGKCLGHWQLLHLADAKNFFLSGASLRLWAEQYQDLPRVKHWEDLCGVSQQSHFCSSSIPSQPCCPHHRQPKSHQAGEKCACGGRGRGREALLPQFH